MIKIATQALTHLFLSPLYACGIVVGILVECVRLFKRGTDYALALYGGILWIAMPKKVHDRFWHVHRHYVNIRVALFEPSSKEDVEVKIRMKKDSDEPA